jgi:hypothetical protein
MRTVRIREQEENGAIENGPSQSTAIAAINCGDERGQ